MAAFQFCVNIETDALFAADAFTNDDSCLFSIQKPNGSNSCGIIRVRKIFQEEKHTPDSETSGQSNLGNKRSSPRAQKIAKVENKGSIKQSVAIVGRPNNASSEFYQPTPNDYVRTILHKRNKLFSCSFCGFESSHKPNVKRHILLKHMREAQEEFRCLTCDSVFHLKQHLKGHYIKVHGLESSKAAAIIDA